MTRRWFYIGGMALAASAVLGIFTAWLEDLEAGGSAPPRFEWLQDEIPPYPGAFYYPLGRDLHTNGIPREMGYAVTEDPARKVADRYEAVWQSQGRRVQRRTSGEEEWLLAGEASDPVLRTIVATPVEGGRTVIVASVSRKLELVGEQRVPVPESCDVISSNGARDGVVATELLMLRCAKTLNEVLTFYDRSLANTRRQALVVPTIDHKDAQVTFTGETLNVSLLATQAEDQPPVTIASVTWQENR